MIAPGIFLRRPRWWSTPVARAALFAPVLALASGQALAFWLLVPTLDTGLTWEQNPRYLPSELRDDIAGTFLGLGLEGSYRTPANQVGLSTQVRQTNYLRSNKDLNDNDWSADLSASHTDSRGSVGLGGGYREVGIRTGEFESATPSDPNAPPSTDVGSGRFADGTQKSRNVQGSLSYNLSPRNTAALSASIGKTSYDVPGSDPLSSSYLDYTYDSVSLAMSHYLNAKNFVQVALNASSFSATQAGGPFENSTSSFGIDAAYNLVFSPKLSATARLGTTRSSVDVSGLQFDPLTGAFCFSAPLCTDSTEESNLTGSISLRQRSELTTLNFDVSRALAPRSNGTQVVQDDFRVYLSRPLTDRLSASAGAIYSTGKEVGRVGRLDQTYITGDAALTYQLTPTLSATGRYSYVSSEDTASNADRRTNHRLFFGVSYRGVGFRR